MSLKIGKQLANLGTKSGCCPHLVVEVILGTPFVNDMIFHMLSFKNIIFSKQKLTN